MSKPRFSVLGPLMGGHGSRAFLGRVHEDEPDGSVKTRPVVFVFLPAEVEEHPEVLGQIVDETKVASRIDHPNVIGVWGVTRLDEGMARIVDFANGESLRAVLRQVRDANRTIPPTIASAIAADACMGVHYAHELGLSEAGAPMVHGGIRPETLLCTFEGRGMVTGYGASTLADWFRRGQGVDGSIRDPYTAPEQTFGGRAAATVPTDVYALGTVLWELLTLESPPGHFRPQDNSAFERELIDEKLQHVGPMLPGIVMKALRSMAPSRYATPLDMRHALLDAGVAPADEVAAFLEDLFPSGSLGRAARNDLIASPLDPRPSDQEGLTSDAPDIEIPEWAAPATVHESGEFSTMPQGSAPEAALPLPPSPEEVSGPVVTREDTPVFQAAPAPRPAPETRAPAAAAPPPPAAAAPPVAPSAYAAPPPPARSGLPTNAILLLLVGLLGGALVVALFLNRGTDTPPVQTPAEKAAVDKAAAAAAEATALQAKLDAALAEKAATEKKAAEAELKAKEEVAAKAKAKAAKKPSRRGRRKSSSGMSSFQTSSKAKLYIDAPPGTAIYVDGRKRGTAPLGPLDLSLGSHTVIAKKDGANVKRSFRVAAGQEVTFSANFRMVP